MTRAGAGVLVTNDDGIASEGLRRLAIMAVDAGLDVTVAAPDTDSSGASASLAAVTEGGRVPVEPRALAGLEGVATFAVGAAPAFIAQIATRGAFGRPPDLVLSGVNRGHNAGQAVLHSGTVGAALTGASRGCRAMAVSIVGGKDPHWESAIVVAGAVLARLIDTEPRTVVNVNVPDIPPAQLRGVRAARLASFGAVQTNVTEAGAGYVQLEVVDVGADLEPGTDAALLAQGWATLTVLEPICEADGSVFDDLTLPDPNLAAR